jgi:hypothetical protein
MEYREVARNERDSLVSAVETARRDKTTKLQMLELNYSTDAGLCSVILSSATTLEERTEAISEIKELRAAHSTARSEATSAGDNAIASASQALVDYDKTKKVVKVKIEDEGGEAEAFSTPQPEGKCAHQTLFF